MFWKLICIILGHDWSEWSKPYEARINDHGRMRRIKVSRRYCKRCPADEFDEDDLGSI